MIELKPRTNGALFVSGEVTMRNNHLTQSRNCYGKEMYGTTIFFSCLDEDTYNKLFEAMRTAYDMEHWKFCENGVETPFEELIKPLRLDEFSKEKYFMSCTTSERPGLVDSDMKEMKQEPLAGSTGRVSMSFHCKNIDGKKLIYPVLHNVQVIRNRAEREYKVEDDFCTLSDLSGDTD